MTVQSYHSDVLTLLRDDYGVVDTELSRGGNHWRVTFTYDGTSRQITLNNKAFGPGALDMKRRDIRRLLGDPPPRPARVRRTMEEMMPFNALPLQAPAQVSPSVAAPGRLAVYATGIRFDVPVEIATAFGASEGTPVSIAVAQNDYLDLWTITPRAGGHKRPSMHFADRTKRYEINHPDTGGTAPCGLSPAEYLLEGDTILVRCPMATRETLAANAGKQKTRRRGALPVDERQTYVAQVIDEYVAEREIPKADDIVTTPWQPVAVTVRMSDANAIRAVLADLRHIEATTPYRLGRRTSTGAWCFSAPRIE